MSCARSGRLTPMAPAPDRADVLRHLKSLAKVGVLRTLDRRRLYVLTFHIIGPDGHGTATPPEHFAQSLDWLKANCRMTDLQDWFASPRTGPNVAITFDDGHRSVVEQALPLLRERNIPATLFVNTAYWDRTARGCWSDCTISDIQVAEEDIGTAVARARHTRNPEEYRHLTTLIEDAVVAPLRGKPDAYLSREEIFALDDPLLSIGLHGHWHHRHSMFSPAWEEENIATCLSLLAEHPRLARIFAAPFGKAGDVTPHTAALCDRLGLRLALNDGGYCLPGAPIMRRIASDRRDVGTLVRSASPVVSRRSALPLVAR